MYDSGESREGGGDGYGSVGDTPAARLVNTEEGLGGEMLTWRLRWWEFPYTLVTGDLVVPREGGHGDCGPMSSNLGDEGALPFNSRSSAVLEGSIMSRVASTLLILLSPFATSLVAVLYMYKPTKVNPIPRPWIG